MCSARCARVIEPVAIIIPPTLTCPDIAKCVDAPVIHVNADDAEAVSHAARIAIEYRCAFKKDVVTILLF